MVNDTSFLFTTVIYSFLLQNKNFLKLINCKEKQQEHNGYWKSVLQSLEQGNYVILEVGVGGGEEATQK